MTNLAFPPIFYTRKNEAAIGDQSLSSCAAHRQCSGLIRVLASEGGEKRTDAIRQCRRASCRHRVSRAGACDGVVL